MFSKKLYMYINSIFAPINHPFKKCLRYIRLFCYFVKELTLDYINLFASLICTHWPYMLDQ